MEPIIRVSNLIKSFGSHKVLDGLSFDVKKGECLVILGGSGCGKSTCLRLMIGAHQVDSGDIQILGKDITAGNRKVLDEVRKRIGIVYQFGALYNSMTVGENIALPLREHTDLSEDVIKIMIKMKLELVGLRDFESLKPSELSGGMKKRVGISRAMALDPEIIFYDEPTAGLDPIVAGVIDQLISDLNKKLGVTSIVVTHDMNSAFKLADRIILLYKGRVVEDGTAKDIQSSKDPLVQQFITGSPDGPIPQRVSKVDYIEDLLR